MVEDFSLGEDRIRLWPSLSLLDRVHDGVSAGVTPPEPVLVPFAACLRCGRSGGVRWLGSRFDPHELAACHLVSVELLHDFDCLGCGERFERLQVT